ncbi:Excitatory amino acid transporter 4 [Frankliniella fusca]|uniref:Excitatory amino acid transporter 4 n=1 Tax=Frankliniella fusca TaxID=407009 RepID=A0AAE1LRF5_9NEOP|nr:Excitatory amino acid transporter 4 [Frankliniella fusca]
MFMGPNKDGLPSKEGSVCARRQEQEKARMRQVNAAALHIHGNYETIQQAGPSGACQHQSFARKVNRLPKIPDEPRRQELQQRLKNLVYRKPSTTKTNLFNKGIYACPYELARFKRKYALKPKKLYIKMLKMLVIKQLLGEDGISALGNKGLVKITPEIIQVSLAYALTVFKESGGDAKTVLWNPDKVLENLIGNCRRQKREGRYTDSSDEEDIIDSENSDLISTDGDLNLSGDTHDGGNLSSMNGAQNVNSNLNAASICREETDNSVTDSTDTNSSMTPDTEISNSVIFNSITIGEKNNNSDLARNLNMQVDIQESGDSVDLSVDSISLTPLKPIMIVWQDCHENLGISRNLDYKELSTL